MHRARSLLLPLIALLAPPAGAAPPVFTDVTAAAGVSYVQHVPRVAPDCAFAGFMCPADVMTGGAAVADVDGDGWLDLFVTRLYEPDLLFLNQGDGTFTDGTAAAGLDGFDLHSNGAAFGDVDNDGDPDLYVTTTGDTRHYLFVNDGSGHFTEEALARGAAVSNAFPHYGTSPTFGDYDRDGFLDLYVAEWRGDSMAPGAPSNAVLLHNRGRQGLAGHFEDVTAAAGVSVEGIPNNNGTPGHYAFTGIFADADADGWPDLLIAGDFGTSRLFWNDGDGTFTDGTVAAGVGSDENGMGTDVGDVDGDGDLDWFVTAIYDTDPGCPADPSWGCTGNRLYRNEGGRSFSDATGSAATGLRDGGWGWGASFLDYDNDGDLDLVMTNGVDFPDDPSDAAFNADAMRLWRNDGGGTWTAVAAASGVTDTGSGKGLLPFDYDGDGDLDVFVVNNISGGLLLRNDGGNANDWLRVRAQGRLSNRDSMNARVRVTPTPGAPPQVHEIGGRSHYLAQGETTAHFGLGPGPGPAVHEVRITWPTGRFVRLLDVPRNTTIVVTEPTSSCGLLGLELLVFPAGLALVRRRRRAR